MKESQALEALAALSEETRLRMFRFLVSCGTEGAPAGEISDAVGASSSRASFHLAALSRAGLLSSTKKARQVIYYVDFKIAGHLVAFLIEDCCGRHPFVLQCCNSASGNS